jgi:hypothetical protein
LQVGGVIVVAKECLLPPIPSLGYVMRQTRNDQSRQSSHAGNLLHPSQNVNIGSCPRNLSESTGIYVPELRRLSSGAAAALAGVPRVVFLAKLADYGVDTFDLNEEQLAKETRLA